MKLIVCCDYGLDDALATADLLAHAAEDGYSVDIVAVGGNVPPAVALENAKKLVENCASKPACIVDTTDMVQPFCFLKDIHGTDGMGNLFKFVRCSVPVLPFRAWLGGLKEEYVLLSLGPMTVVPDILKKGNCTRFVFMGGNIAETPNYRGYEFNHALNRSAFSAAVRRAHVAVTMDTCRHPLFNIQEEEIAGDGLLRKIARRIREQTFVSGEKGCYVWDDIAVKYLRHPDWFETYEAADKDGNALTVARYTYGKKFTDILEA